MNHCTTIIPYTPPLSPEEFIRREVERIQAVELVGSSLSLNGDKILLIEGSRSESSKFPEIGLSEQLARLNNIDFFDCIHSFDKLHLSKFLASQSMRDHKKIAIYVIRLFMLEGKISDIIDKIIKPGFVGLVENGIYTAVPEWLDHLKNDFYLIESLREIERSFISKDEFQFDYDSIKKILSIVSNQISAEAFLNYIKEHPEIKEVYGIIGLNHIDFLDNCAVRVESSENERHLQLNILNREINVHLFGGTHGELAYYEKMSSFLGERGMFLPQVSRETDNDLITLLVTLLLSKFMPAAEESSSCFHFQEEHDHSGLERFEPGIALTPLATRLDEASKEFDYWMKHYTHFPRKTDEEELLDWIFCDSGGALISNFDEFIALASKLDGNGYVMKMMPTQAQFEQALLTFRERERQRLRQRNREIEASSACFHYQEYDRSRLKQEIKVLKPLASRLEKASKKFDYWMKNYTHPPGKTNEERLLDWIFCDSGGALIVNFDEFIALAIKLDGNGYPMKEMPTKAQFEQALSTFQERER